VSNGVKSMSESTARWFSTVPKVPNAGGAWLNVYCIAHAGAGTGAFVPWRAVVPPGIALKLVRLPGRESRSLEMPLTSLFQAAAAVAVAIQAEAPQVYALFGHCSGAWIAFEAARELTLSGLLPLALYASGQVSPSLHNEKAQRVSMSDDELLNELVRSGGTAATILASPEIVEHILPTLRADRRMVDTYRYDPTRRPLLGSPVRVLVGQQDDLSLAELDAWQCTTSAPLEIWHFPGDHFFIWSEARDILLRIRRDAELLAKRGRIASMDLG
jgi:medium-chain acyl-[acyl-carrier-protein] hydrolase